MDTTFDEDHFFTTLLQSGEQGRSTTVMASSHDNVGLQATLLEGEKRPPSKKTQRGVSFTIEEDNLLVSAWLNISMAESTPLGDDTIDDNVEVIFERPPGKKAEKERERKRKAAESYDAEFVEALTCMTNDRAVFMSERRQATSKLDVDRAQLLVEKKRRNDTENRKIDIEIMKIDLAGMNGMQREYFLNIQKEEKVKSETPGNQNRELSKTNALKRNQEIFEVVDLRLVDEQLAKRKA
ncbi:uncharacterized protein LOC118348409 [Juglans regia]|uniref:Uncharacterized protein LOC118348409 n=1 Tax=Juglans regia TaxID=51240 RepID=A0A6P9EEN5_JUGRE|nr:uncharacterized protein LOC118348409 [Juglans regia]